jgi:hypothetical protein
LVNALYAADAVGALARTEARSCVWWAFRNGPFTQGNNSAALYGTRQFGDYGIVADGTPPSVPADHRYPAFFAAKLLTHWGRGGDAVIGAVSDFPLISPHAARRLDGSLSLMIINRSAVSDLNVEVAFTGFVPGAGTATLRTYGKPEDSADQGPGELQIVVGPGGFTRTFPAYSMSAIAIPKPLTFETWRQEWFSAAELANPAISGEDADADGDGWSTLVEYFLGLDPKTPDGGGLQIAGTSEVNGNEHLTFSFPNPLWIIDVDFEVLVSDDLARWVGGPGEVERIDDGLGAMAVYRDTRPIAGSGRRFLRLRVVRR